MLAGNGRILQLGHVDASLLPVLRWRQDPEPPLVFRIAHWASLTAHSTGTVYAFMRQDLDILLAL